MSDHVSRSYLEFLLVTLGPPEKVAGTCGIFCFSRLVSGGRSRSFRGGSSFMLIPAVLWVLCQLLGSFVCFLRSAHRIIIQELQS